MMWMLRGLAVVVVCALHQVSGFRRVNHSYGGALFPSGGRGVWDSGRKRKDISRASSLSMSVSTTTRPTNTLSKRRLRDLGPHHLSGKKVLLRSDLNVPMDGNIITDDSRLKASIETIAYLLGYGANVIIATHIGRPKGKEDRFSVRHIQQRLSELLNKQVAVTSDCIGPEVDAAVANMKPGDVLLLENVRFHPEETKNDAGFARALARNADLFVNDAFGAAHRAHASTEGVSHILTPAVAGLLLEKEIAYLSKAVQNPRTPFAAVVGGSKVSTKIGLLEALLDKVDKLFVGGGMVFTFFKARGLNVGTSIVEDDKIDTAKRLEKLAAEKGVELIFPTDVVIADKFSPDAETRVVKYDQIPDGWRGLDHGPETTKMMKRRLADCKTIMWNGPMGVSEFEKFAAGTNDLAQILADLTDKGATTIIGGGDSVAAVKRAGLADVMTHLSTGGGATLELVEGKVLPGLAALDDEIL